jgi:hypothetical protein
MSSQNSCQAVSDVVAGLNLRCRDAPSGKTYESEQRRDLNLLARFALNLSTIEVGSQHPLRHQH